MADFSFVDGNAPSATTWNANVRDQLIVICTSSTRPSAPTTGRHIWETDTLKGYYYNGSTWVQDLDTKTFAAWTSFTPVWTAASVNPAIGNGTLAGAYRQIGKTLDCRFTINAGGTTTFGTGQWQITLPNSLSATASFGAGVGYISSNSVTYTGHIAASGTLAYLYSTTATNAAVTGTAPNTFTATGYFYGQFRCEVA